jgi:hypothetical protein
MKKPDLKLKVATSEIGAFYYLFSIVENRSVYLPHFERLIFLEVLSKKIHRWKETGFPAPAKKSNLISIRLTYLESIAIENALRYFGQGPLMYSAFFYSLSASINQFYQYELKTENKPNYYPLYTG